MCRDESHAGTRNERKLQRSLMINNCVYYKLAMIARILIATNKRDCSLLFKNTTTFMAVYRISLHMNFFVDVQSVEQGAIMYNAAVRLVQQESLQLTRKIAERELTPEPIKDAQQKFISAIKLN